MSAGPRIPLALADRAAAYLIEAWEIRDAMIVGSVRRRRENVGDLEIVTTHERTDDDRLCRILRSAAAHQDGLFAEPADVPPIEIERGLKPGFKACAIVAFVRVEGVGNLRLPVQIHRHEPGQRGWLVLHRTGPSEFGKWVLGQWKRDRGIPPERKGSVDGYLVDYHGARVPIHDENEIFDRLGIARIAPERRDEFVANLEGVHA